MKSVLALEDGRLFFGESFGAPVEEVGEVVFNTSMSGYQEVITDPSYCGQIVVMTYPLIGNYGINPEDFESSKIHLKGFVIKELSGIASNWRSRQTLDEFLKEHGIPGIQGVDTRALTRHIREKGAQQAVISSRVSEVQSLIQIAKSAPGLVGQDMVKQVTCSTPYDWKEGNWTLEKGYNLYPQQEDPFFVVAYDLGIKTNILRMLTEAGCKVRVVSANTSAQEVLAMEPDGIFLSNGPGDPEGVPYVAQTVRDLLGKVPILGICLGHQIITLALGGETYKLKFGHHGGNQPVQDMTGGRVEITSQNHGFAVNANKIPKDVEVLSINLNDRTVEGIRHKKYPLISVQYHPEASPGPHDSSYVFEEFVKMMKACNAERKTGSAR